MISKLYATAIEAIDTGILESLDAMGCTMPQKIRMGVMPQLSASFVSTAVYRFDLNLKDASTLGIVGAGGIGSPLVQAISDASYPVAGSIIWTLVVLVLVVELFSTRIRRMLAYGQR